MGLMVQPFWSPDLKNPAAKGSMVGFGDVHKKAHVYRAVIEGLAFGLLDGLKDIEKACQQKIKRVAVSGGASQSDEICQITSDIFNLPLVKGQTHETSGLGAAIVTAVGTGLFGSFDQAIRKMVRFEKEFMPQAEHREIYQKLYVNVYRKMYRALEPLYKEIRDITGYPEKIE
jgi:sugar (pentulose or hexulose) kinase